jgi:CRP-like cAMP-binding protein
METVGSSPAATLAWLVMTRDEFLKDCEDAGRLLSDLAAGDVLAEEMAGKLASLRSDARAIRPHDLRRYADAIDWERQHDPMVVQRLARVLLRITVGLSKELESFQHAVKA